MHIEGKMESLLYLRLYLGRNDGVAKSQGDLAERGVEVSYESVRQWCNRFGPQYAVYDLIEFFEETDFTTG